MKRLIIKHSVFPTTCGMTLYSGTICLRDRYILDEDLNCAKVKCIVTLLHEIAHCKRIKYYSDGRFYLFTPEKLDYEEIDRESGTCLENYLFGGEINLRALPDDLAKLVLDPENYSTIQKVNQLKESLKPCLLFSAVSCQRIKKCSRAATYPNKCGMSFFKPIRPFDDS